MSAPISNRVTEEELQAFCADQDARYEANLRAMKCDSLIGSRKHGYTVGQKYARIYCFSVTNPERDRSVTCFIDMDKGHILKDDGWKKPAGKNPIRGTIFAPDRGASCMGPHGPNYLRGH